MVVRYQYKVKKKLHHVFLMVIAAIVILILINYKPYGLGLLALGPLYLSFLLIFIVIIAIALSVFYFPNTIYLSNKIIVRYLIRRERKIDFSDIQYYHYLPLPLFPTFFDSKLAWRAPDPEIAHLQSPSIIVLMLRKGRTLSFFFSKDDYDHIENYFKRHKVKRRFIVEYP